MKKALIAIDIQNDYFKGGKMALHHSEQMLNQSNKLIEYANIHAYPIYIIQHIAEESSSFFVPETKGVNLHPELNISHGTAVIQKHYPNSFRETTLRKELEKEGINELIICGAMTHMCIDTTVRAGADLGYMITLVIDACSTKDLEFDGNTVAAEAVQTSYMAALDGTFCQVVDTATLMQNT